MKTNNYLTESIENLVRHMQLEKLSSKTINSYVNIIKKLAQKDSRIYRLSNKDIQEFILQSSSASAQNLKVNALKKFFYVNHPSRKVKAFIRPKIEKKIIEVLTQREAMAIINSISNPKQKAIISGLYFHGLRLNEILNLNYNDIDRERNILFIKNAKGKKDRLVPLHEKWIHDLIRYAKYAGHGRSYSGNIFMPYSESSVRSILKRKVKALKINKNVYPHLLRDSYATHLLEQGVDSRFIQKILGHTRITTTQKYMHVSSHYISNVKLKIA